MNLLDRYSLGTGKAIARINDCVACLSDMGCAPTFFTPGIIVQRNPAFIRSLQAAGAQIAVHSFQHFNLAELPIAEARAQLEKAVHTFERYGIEHNGFRCSYLGYTDELLDALPPEMFGYSSNQSISWEDLSSGNGKHETLLFGALAKFYRAEDSSKKMSVPWMRSNMLEIPVSIPDDLQLHDGLNLGPEGIALAWDKILVETHRRGELFNLIFHTEQAKFCDNPFIELIRRSRQHHPAVWIAKLEEIMDWWSEKANFSIEIQPTSEGLQLSIICSPRATILVRGIEIGDAGIHWEGPYNILQSRRLEVPAIPRPCLKALFISYANRDTFWIKVKLGTYVEYTLIMQSYPNLRARLRS
jgi:peptidoglycan/xylan/chitin deacetylase (PgdA/CDA1 family)